MDGVEDAVNMTSNRAAVGQTRGRPLQVAALNEWKGLGQKVGALQCWMVNEWIDILCLTETGKGDPGEDTDVIFVAHNMQVVGHSSCVIMVAPWQQTRLQPGPCSLVYQTQVTTRY